ncbi:MAG TPA: hypothetical protein VFG89_07140, partial [Coriobacteriia bacterium]|nr:hypothetical protein [Coriobacteriia bacterium]
PMAAPAPEPAAFVEPEIDLDSFLPPEPSPAQDEFLLPVPLRAEPEAVEPAPAVAEPVPVEDVAQQVFTPISIDDLPNPSEFDASVMKPVSAPTQPMPANDPAPSGLISAVNLGELEAPDIPDDFDLVEPSEFALPRFDALGEREDDLDIEEID